MGWASVNYQPGDYVKIVANGCRARVVDVRVDRNTAGRTLRKEVLCRYAYDNGKLLDNWFDAKGIERWSGMRS